MIPRGHSAVMALDDLLAWARSHPMSEKEARAQRISFAYGNCRLENDRITREMVEQADAELFP